MIRQRSIRSLLTAALAAQLASAVFAAHAGAGVATGAVRPAAPFSITVLPADPETAVRSFIVVLLADTRAARIKGLQGFRALLPREAALFSFDPPQDISFWMASLTYSIDIIYVDAAGKITQVFPDCQPDSREVYSSVRPVRWVIETAAGSGIQPGDRVRIE